MGWQSGVTARLGALPVRHSLATPGFSLPGILEAAEPAFAIEGVEPDPDEDELLAGMLEATWPPAHRRP